MRWTSMELAALATAAVPGLSATGVAAAADDARDFTAAVVIDAEGNRWRIRSPQHQEAAMRLETELQVLRGFSTGIRAELPFRVPSVAGVVRRDELRTFVYNHLPGTSLHLDELAEQPREVIDDVGRTIAAIHDLDPAVVDNAELPRYSAEQFRQRRLNELDQAATTGQIPPLLLRRWEHALEERQLWQFTPVVTHGDLHEDSLLIDGQRVVAVTGWTDLHIGDPADDFAWLTATSDASFTNKVLAAYGRHRQNVPDPYLLRRAALAAEFALAQWLVRGHASSNQQMVDEALGLLEQLKDDVETYGGQPIALSPPEDDRPRPAETQHSQPVARPGAQATVADTGEWAETGIGDDEPAVITDAAVDEDAGPDENASPTDAAPGEDTGPTDAAPDPGIPQGRWAEADDEPTGELQAVPADADEESPTSGSLPVVADETSEKRAKTKNFFPPKSADSAGSADSPRSADSANSAGSASSADSASSAGSEQTEGSTSSDSEPDTDDSIYSSYPGLRPPRG